MRITTLIMAVCGLSIIAALWLALFDAAWLTWHWGLAVSGWCLIAAVAGLLSSRYRPKGGP